MSSMGNEISFISRSSIKNVTFQTFQLPNAYHLLRTYIICIHFTYPKHSCFLTQQSLLQKIDDLWNQFFSKSEKLIPMFYNKTLSHIENIFQQYHFSFITFIQHIQMATALFFSQSGKYKNQTNILNRIFYL